MFEFVHVWRFALNIFFKYRICNIFLENKKQNKFIKINQIRISEFPKWGGICDSGTRQSPINLSLRGAIKGIYEKLEGDNYDKTISEVSMTNTGHSSKIW